MSIRGTKVVFMLAKLLCGIWLAAVAFSTVFIMFYLLTVVYFFYRLIWLFSSEGTTLRMERKFRRYMDRILQEGIRQRATLSRTVDQENIKHIVMLVNQEINLRKVHLDPPIVTEIQNLLKKCRYTQDFNKVLCVHKLVVDTDVALLNSTLSELLDDC